MLTSSVQRNLDILEFLQETIAFSSQEISQLIYNRPQILMTSLPTLRICWAVLTDVYGFSNAEARALIRKMPSLLSTALVKKQRDKVLYFSSKLNLPPPFSEIQTLVKRCPRLLTFDLEYFIKPNVGLLEHYLRVNHETLHKMVRLHPTLLLHNPRTLESRIVAVLHFLTGNDSFKNCTSTLDPAVFQPKKAQNLGVPERYPVDDDDDDLSYDQLMDDVLGSFELTLNDTSSLEALIDSDVIERSMRVSESSFLAETGADLPPELNLDLIFDIVYSHVGDGAVDNAYSEGELDFRSTQIFYEMSRRLCLTETKAVSICCSIPCILSYRPQRNSRVASSLAVSLGMTSEEISKCVSTYPRLVCLSAEGKLSAVLRLLASSAAHWLSSVLSALPRFEQLAFIRAQRARTANDVQSFSGCDYDAAAFMYRRGNLIRALVRGLIIRYPNILGTSLDKISAAVDKVIDSELAFDQVLRLLRKATPKPSTSGNDSKLDLDVLLLD